MTIHDEGISNVFRRGKEEKKMTGRILVKYQEVPPCTPPREVVSVFIFPSLLVAHLTTSIFLHFRGATPRLVYFPPVLNRASTQIKQKRRQIYT
jgi:hypothetical protein